MVKVLEEVLYPIPTIRSTPPWFRIKRNYFTVNQCEKILRIAKSRQFRRDHSQDWDKDVDTQYLLPPDAEWVYSKMARVFATENVWNFAVTAIVDPVCIQKYEVGGYNASHSDVDYDTSDHSKLTIIIPLVPSNRWRGGRIKIGGSGVSPSLDRGDCLVFPSFVPHEVTPVTRGARIILSAWAAGPPLI